MEVGGGLRRKIFLFFFFRGVFLEPGRGGFAESFEGRGGRVIRELRDFLLQVVV